MAKKSIPNEMPFNASAEQAVLGAALIKGDILYQILAALDSEDYFYVEKHRTIYRALISLYNKKIGVDAVTVTEELVNMKELENVGGVEYLKKCMDSMVAISSLDYYINIVNDQAVLRKLLIAVREIDEEYGEKEITDVNDFIIRSEAKIHTATEKRRTTSFKDAKLLATELAGSLNKPLSYSEENLVGLTSGYPAINNITSGFHPGDMIVIAARPSVGKTALALNMAFNAAKKGKPVAIFSLEMTNEQLMSRLLGISSNVPLKKITNRDFNDRDKARINASIRELSQLPLYINETSGIKLMDIVANSKKLQAEHPDLALIIVDYLGLVTNDTGSRSSDNRQEEVRKISLGLKTLAKELKIPVIAVSQLSRNVEQRGESKRPMLSDLRDSGSIEQDADVVMLLYREDYYKAQKGQGQKSLGDKKLSQMSDSERFESMKTVAGANGQISLPGDASLVEVNIAKNRNGSTGQVQLFFYKAYGRFEPPSKEWVEQMKAIREGNEQ